MEHKRHQPRTRNLELDPQHLIYVSSKGQLFENQIQWFSGTGIVGHWQESVNEVIDLAIWRII